tara:strand:+ start:678 stop:1112 length:435 start_codon:yes stop_codon:yes gene_type:complete
MNNNLKFRNLLKLFITVEKDMIKSGEEESIKKLKLNRCKCKTLIYGYNKDIENYNKYKNKTNEGLNELLDSQMFGEGVECIGVNVDDVKVGDSSALWLADQMTNFKETCEYIEEYIDGGDMDYVSLEEDNSSNISDNNIYNIIT